jgi:serine/arginine repetitive matrix protein 2
MEAALEPAVEDVRKVAIAKLKRAASLPRMKDGRRPAMHAEGVSEGEKSGVSTPLPLQADDLTAPDSVLAQADAEPLPQLIQTSASPNPRYGPTPPPNDSAPEETPKTNSHKRRSRSRSRSRGSKDFRKQKNQALITPQSQSPRSEESSQDEESVPVGHTLPPPMVPSPIHFFPQQQPMHSNNPLFQNFIPNAPPSLEALQRHIMAGSGLQRSSSAREQAMNKLLGRQDQASNNQGGPPSAFPGAKLVRSNTSTGFERNTRHVARNELFRKLSNRRAAGNGGTTTEGEQTTSGGEEFTSASKKPAKRPPGNTVIDDRDPPHLSPSPAPMRALTPKTHLTPLMAHSTMHDRHPSPSPSHASSQTPSARRQSLERNRDSAFAKLTGENQFEFELHRLLPLQQPRLVVEDNDEFYPTEVIRPVPSRYDGNHRSYTPTLSRASPKSEITTQSPQPTPAGNPVLTLAAAVAALEPQDGYPMKTRRSSGANSPFSMVDEQVVYGDDSRSRRAPTDNVISWVELEGELSLTFSV